MELFARLARPALALVSLVFFVSTTELLVAQQDDPSEIFLKAYLSSQQAEKLERESRFKTALAKYRFAGSLIETLRRSHTEWQPAVVEYRGRKISEGILRIQERTARQNALGASANRLPDVAPAIPEGEAWSEPGREVVAPQSGESAQTPRDDASNEPSKKWRDKVDQLQAALGKARTELDSARRDRETAEARLKETNSKLAQAEADIHSAKTSDHDARGELAKTQESLRASQLSQESTAKEQQQLRAEVARLTDALTEANQARATAEKQRDEVQSKFVAATEQLAGLEHQRDEAFAHLKATKEIDQGVQILAAEKDDLQQKLTIAEKKIQALTETDPNAQKVAEVNQELAELHQELAASEKRNDYLAARAAELGVQLDDASTELQDAKLAGANGQESERLTKENELLRNIIVRERQEEARRDDARKVVIAELDKLKIRSDVLNRQIEFLAQPITTLSTEELALLRQPVLSVSDQRVGLFKASFVFEKKSEASWTGTAAADASEKSSAATDASVKTADASRPAVSRKTQSILRAAKKNLDQGEFRTAEKQYEQILAADPNSVDALSNLGVLYYRSGKLPLAESMLTKAVESAPDNDFLLTTLGVIHYRQSNFDDAMVELRKAIAINPKNATAHNYLGIAASQKGRQQEAENEILQALASNPNDADAHFNLAVILATTRPGAKQLAREHYARATALGTQRSPSLEKLLQ